MEKPILETGAFETNPLVPRPSGALQAANSAHLHEQHDTPPPVALRYGYREDSPPEVIDLLHRAQAGDAEAFADLYRTQIDRVTRYVGARMRQRDRDAIPDLVQDAFCDALADLPLAHHDVTGWLLAHAAKACTRHEWTRRRYIRAAKTVQENARPAAQEVEPASDLPTAIGHLTLVHALSRLAPDQRRAMHLRFMDGLPRQHRAEELDRSLVALKSLEWRALRNLRAVFQAPAAKT